MAQEYPAERAGRDETVFIYATLMTQIEHLALDGRGGADGVK